ncbi:autophagy protein 16 [Patellaria atrata CBS 101060]|uniref:Autophagy protein 16 n=1 Tax=Patellaria atrata CBS 101060 TaxID=1346257 RepID=A0A9P4S341_9PEZI|nr:autophagy protein 16 [Patellaria atrata CBS 101060]
MSWLTEYSAAIDARDAREKSQIKYINAYTALADRTASLNNIPQAPPPPSPQLGSSKDTLRTPTKSKSPAQDTTPPGDTVNQLRAELATTQKSRAELQSQLKPLTEHLEQLKLQNTKNTRLISALQREKDILERRVRDRDDELRGKASLVEEIQGEMLTSDLERNMAVQKAEKLEAENRELVERWMRRMEHEADRMNEGSGWT